MSNQTINHELRAMLSTRDGILPKVATLPKEKDFQKHHAIIKTVITPNSVKSGHFTIREYTWGFGLTDRLKSLLLDQGHASYFDKNDNSVKYLISLCCDLDLSN